jgi:hypothetical protein
VCNQQVNEEKKHWSLLLSRRKAIEEEIRVEQRRCVCFTSTNIIARRTDSTNTVIKSVLVCDFGK